MKKTITKLVCVFALFACIFALVAATSIVFAATESTTVTEDFNRQLQTSKWSTNSDDIAVEVVGEHSKVLRLGAAGANQEQAALFSEAVIPEGVTEITFDMYKHTSNWLGLYFNSSAKNDDAYKWTGAFVGVPIDEWVSIKIDLSDADVVKILCAADGGEFEGIATKELSAVGKYMQLNYNVDDKSGYIYIDNFKIGEITDTFENCDAVDDSALLRVVSDITADIFILDLAVSELRLSGAKSGEYIISNTILKADTDDSFPHDTSIIDAALSLKISDTAESVGYVFGVAKGNSGYDLTKSFYCIRFGGTSIGLYKYDADGAAQKLCENVDAVSDFSSGVDVTVKVLGSGKITVAVDEVSKLSYDNSDSGVIIAECAGYNGFVALTDIGENSDTAIDNFNLTNSYYVAKWENAITTKSVNTNFNLNYFGEEGHEDFVYRASGGAIDVTDGELVFTKCDDDTYFGPNYEYEDFICEFKLTSIYVTDSDANKTVATAPDKWIGLDFGKKGATVFPYGTYGMIYTNITSKTDSVVNLYTGTGSSMDGQSVSVREPIPNSYFEAISYDGTTSTRQTVKAEDAVCFRYVANNGTLQLYIKSVKEDEYKLYYQIDNIDTRGYISLAMTGYLFATIDDFSVSNTSEIYNIAETYIPSVTIEKVVYDRSNVDVNASDEFTLNKYNDFFTPFIICAVVAAVAVVNVVVLAVIVWKKKSKR